jgi:short-subunit dehydrogenase
MFQEVFKQHSRIDIVIANAGTSEQGTSGLVKLDEEMPSELSLKTLNVNL